MKTESLWSRSPSTYVFGLHRLPATVLLKNSVAVTTVSCHSRATRTQRVQPELERVSPNGLQIPPESFSHSAVTNRLIGGYQLTRILTLRNGSKNQIPGIWKNVKFGEILFKALDRTRGTRKLRNNYFVSSTKMFFLTLGDFHHQSFLRHGTHKASSLSVVSRLSPRGWLALCRLAIAPICQLVQSSCQAFTATVTAPGAKSHCTSPWQALPYSTVVHLPRTRTLGDGLWGL